MNDPEASAPPDLSFFDRRWVKATAFIIGLLGFAFAVWSYYTGIREPGITYTVDPVRTTLVQSGVSSDLTVQFNGQPVTDTVTSVAIGLWNDGRAPVKATDILRPMELHLPAMNRILSAKVLRQSRDIVNLRIATPDSQNGTRPQTAWISFDILEHNDSAILQVIYEGDPNAVLSISGVFIGQRQVFRLDVDREALTTNVLVKDLEVLFLSAVSLGIAAFTSRFVKLVAPLFRSLETLKAMTRPLWVVFLVGLAMTCLFAGFAIYFVYTQIIRTPPFSFGG